MSQSVARLKELLFDGEAQALADLARRIDALTGASEADRKALASDIAKLLADATANAEKRREIEQRLDEVAAASARAITRDNLETHVAGVLDGAIRSAEVSRHDQMSDALAPLVVRTIKTEIRNSQDELVEALYPMTGRMVKAYVASAIRDLADQINRRIEANPFMLRLRSLTTGRSMAELAMADTQGLVVEELYLIRRGSGELIARWPNTGSVNRDAVVSGILTAINDFSTEAFESDGSALRHIDLGEAQVYLRASPAYLLAAKCKGAAPAAIEQTIDTEFLREIEHHHALLETYPPGATPASAHADQLEELSKRLEESIRERQLALASGAQGMKPLKMLGLAFGIPLLLWLGWTLYINYETNRVKSTAQAIIATGADLKGYPLSVIVARGGGSLAVTGLMPGQPAKQDLVARLRVALPRTEIVDSIAVLPAGADELRPRIAEVERDLGAVESGIAERRIRSMLEGAGRRIEWSGRDLAVLQENLGDADARDRVGKSIAAIQRTARELRLIEVEMGSASKDRAMPAELSRSMASLSQSIAEATRLVSILAGEGGAAGPDVAAPPEPPATLLAGVEDIAVRTERLSGATLAAVQASRIKIPVPVVLPPPAPPPPAPVAVVPTPRERLERFIRSNAIFFSNGVEFRAPEKAERVLDDLAALVKEAGVLVRVVGYTDERGGSNRNASLSDQRAEKVQAALVQRGVPPSRIAVVGRQNLIDPSRTIGAASPNRRVEFEIGFDGEGAE